MQYNLAPGSLRGLLRTPGFAATAVGTLALGIGLATAVFTVAHALLLRRLPVRDQDRLVVTWGESRDGRFANYPLGLADAREFARRTQSLERVAFFGYEGAYAIPIRDGDQISRLRRALVSGEFFDVLDVEPLLGRALRQTDDEVGAPPVLVLSHRAWQERFGRDPSILGRTLLMYESGVAYTIVGVMPQGLDYPRGTDFWAPVGFTSTPQAEMPYRAFNVIGRLRPGATPRDAQNEMTAFFNRAEASPWQRDLRGVVHTLPRLILGDVRPALWVFSAAAGLLLLITCINVANLLLVRGLARVREIVVRAALGAGRGRIVRQLLTESGILALTGGALGVGVAAAAVQAFLAFAPAGTPRLDEIHVSTTALVAATAITGAAMLLFALAPAVVTSRVELQQALRSDARQSAGKRSRLAREALVAAQIALALLVLSAAGLIAKSLIKLERAELSFEPTGLLIGELALRYDQYDNVTKQVALLEQLMPAVQALPGVRAASPVVAVPFSGTAGWDGRPAREGQSAEEAATNPMLNMELVSPSYFAALGVPILRGRSFTEADREGTPAVVLVSASAARLYWPGSDPIGQRLRMGADLEERATVVGVAPDTRYRDLRDARPSIYFPLRQSFFPFAPLTLAIRTSGPPGAVVPAIRRTIRAAASGVELASARPFDSFLEEPLAQPRLNAVLLGVFAVAAVLLAAVALFGAMATMVRQRTRELGIRMVHGATSGVVIWLVLGRGLAIAAAGVAVGIVGTLVLNRLLAAMLYDVSPTDPLTIGIVAALLVAVAAFASGVPARATTRIDPVRALRAEG